jgi:hypothetical protein
MLGLFFRLPPPWMPLTMLLGREAFKIVWGIVAWIVVLVMDAIPVRNVSVVKPPDGAVQ